MSLTLYLHPFSSYCQKVLIALYENGTAFTPRLINLGDPADSAALKKMWGVRKFPVLQDTARDATVPESSIIIEYLAAHYPGPVALIPKDADAAWRTRLTDRFFDFYVMDQASKIITDHFRPADKRDAFGVEQARATLRNSYEMLEGMLADNTWAMGSTFTLADCAAMPALFYADLVLPVPAGSAAARYRDRLYKRPSIARVLAEARATLMAGFPFADAYVANFERARAL